MRDFDPAYDRSGSWLCENARAAGQHGAISAGRLRLVITIPRPAGPRSGSGLAFSNFLRLHPGETERKLVDERQMVTARHLDHASRLPGRATWCAWANTARER